MIDATVKKVIVMLDRRNKGQRLLVIDCPFCREEHTHGGGNEEKDVQLWAGSRSCHCYRSEFTGKKYSLVIPEGVQYEYR